jgi:hypothetical protein
LLDPLREGRRTLRHLVGGVIHLGATTETLDNLVIDVAPLLEDLRVLEE